MPSWFVYACFSGQAVSASVLVLEASVLILMGQVGPQAVSASVLAVSESFGKVPAKDFPFGPPIRQLVNFTFGKSMRLTTSI